MLALHVNVQKARLYDKSQGVNVF